jgi:putative endopeptidase
MMHTGELMRSKFLVALASTAFFLPALCLPAQRPAQPIASMPYSPSLDVSSLDRSVDPCSDFYKFSCGGWQKKNPIPADQSGWSVYAKLGNENQQFLWGILEADAKAKNRTPATKGRRLLRRLHEYHSNRCAWSETGST